MPKEALFISGTNKVVNDVNKERLNKEHGTLISIKATVQNESQGLFKPKLDNTGNIRGTNLQYELNLKKGCRIMLTSNLNVCDSLTNGTQGTVIDFKYSNQSLVEHIIVQFDEEICGKELRKQKNIEILYPGQNATQIEKSEVRFSLSRKKKMLLQLQLQHNSHYALHMLLQLTRYRVTQSRSQAISLLT